MTRLCDLRQISYDKLAAGVRPLRPEFFDHSAKFVQWLFELPAKHRTPRVQDPIACRLHSAKLDTAQSERLSKQPFCPITVMRLAYRFSGGRNSNPVTAQFVGQNKDRHVTAFDSFSLFVNTKKLGPFTEPSLLR